MVCVEAVVKPVFTKTTSISGAASPVAAVAEADVDEEFVAERNAWIEHYDKLSQNFAACKFEKAIGSTTVHPKAEAVRKLHDEYCRSDRGLKIA